MKILIYILILMFIGPVIVYFFIAPSFLYTLIFIFFILMLGLSIYLIKKIK